MRQSSFDVFLSHANHDKPVVELLAQRLQDSGLKPWLDKWNLIPGTPWQPAIEEALSECLSCAVFLGPRGSGPWQVEEMRAAISQRVSSTKGSFRVIPVLLPGAKRGDDLPAFLIATTWIEFHKDIEDEEAFRRLVCGIRGIPPGPESGVPSLKNQFVQVAIKLNGPQEEIKPFLEAIQRELQAMSGDSTLTIKYTRSGSTILVIDCSLEGFKRLSSMFMSGQLTKIAGYQVEDVQQDPNSLVQAAKVKVQIDKQESRLTSKSKILIVDNDPVILSTLHEYLEPEGYDVVEAADLESAFQKLETVSPDIAITAVELPDGDALKFLKFVKNLDIPMDIIVLTGHASMELAVRAMQEGAAWFLTKPVELPALGANLRTCLKHQQDRRKQIAVNFNVSRYEINPFLGTSAAIRRLENDVRKTIAIERPILIQGESGTGKGVLAKWIHSHSSRAAEAFVNIDCASLSKELFESELFGYKKGAFTGATNSRQGLVEVAHRGILFLDEIGEMDLGVQPKLLKVLADNRFRRLGDLHERTTDVEIIAATNRDLMQFAKEMRFREDLYYRISTLELHIPPLRERVEDILVLTNSILHMLAGDLAKEQKKLSKAAEAELKTYHWPGNIRELRNVLERAVLICENRVIEPHHLGLSRGATTWHLDSIPDMTLAELERWRIAQVLEEEKGRLPQAAARLGIPRSTLYQKIKTLGIQYEVS